MFIASSIISALAPFEGAEDNQTLTTQESLRSFERSPDGDYIRSINISPLNGVKPVLGDPSLLLGSFQIFPILRGLFTN